tara:strand:- start:989 stop:1801 length:813 start_codon:yes stop_codon:yes gene_type:complete
MFKKQLLLSITILSCAFSANKQQNEDVLYYDAIYLKNTNIIVGEILSPTNNSDYISIKLKSNGKTQYYYLDDIAKIEYKTIKIKLPPKRRKPLDFITSFGVGLHGFEGELIYTPSWDSDWSDSETVDSIKNVHSLSTDIKLGFVVSKQVSIYISRKDDWFNLDNNGSNVLMSNSLTSIACQIYGEPVGSIWKQSYYYSFGLGSSIYGTYKDDSYQSWKGYGFFFGVGYEITKNINAEVSMTLNTLTPSHENLSEYSMETISPQIFINYTL